MKEYKIKNKYLGRFKSFFNQTKQIKETWYHLCLAYVDLMKDNIKTDEDYLNFCKDKLQGKKEIFRFKKKSYKQDYLKYLDSIDWEKKRQRTFMFKGEECEICERKDHLHIHHATYDNFKDEKDEDLFVFCKDCHYEYHEYIKGKKTTIQLTLDYIEFTKQCKEEYLSTTNLS